MAVASMNVCVVRDFAFAHRSPWVPRCLFIEPSELGLGICHLGCHRGLFPRVLHNDVVRPQVRDLLFP